MKIKSFRIKSFRTITTEQELIVDNELTLVGPNSSGKTNTLISVLAFFTGYDNKYDYNPDRDLPYTQKGVKTSITCTFSGDDDGKDKEIFQKLSKLREMLNLNVESEKENEFSINVYFNGVKPVYQIHPGVKRPKDKQAQFSTAQKQFINSVLDLFQWYYIPSNKSIEELYEEFVTPFVRKKVVSVLDKYDQEIKNSISNLTDSMNAMLLQSGIDGIKTSMDYPGKVMEGFISGLDLYVEDQNSSSIFEKGMGVQAAVLLSSFKWITQQQKEKHVLWLIEEPETFMHPSLAEKCAKIIDSLSSVSTVIKTTHSINFIPPNINRVQGIRLNNGSNTVIQPYRSHVEATEEIRNSLGVKFADYFGLSSMNIFLEGETDRQYIEKVLEACQENAAVWFPILSSGDVQLRDFTGITDLKGFIKANYELMKKDVALVSLVDGDDAGVRAIKELAGFFGKKGGFHAGKDFVLLPGGMAIEGIFPDEWICEAYQLDSAWFESWIPDSEGKISHFSIRDKSKKAYLNYIFEKIECQDNYDWLTAIKPIFNALEDALRKQSR